MQDRDEDLFCAIRNQRGTESDRLDSAFVSPVAVIRHAANAPLTGLATSLGVTGFDGVLHTAGLAGAALRKARFFGKVGRGKFDLLQEIEDLWMTREYMAEFCAGLVTDLSYQSEIEDIAYEIEEDATGENADNGRARLQNGMTRLESWVDNRLFESGVDALLSPLAVRFIAP